MGTLPTNAARAVGVDGAPGGWVSAVLSNGSQTEASDLRLSFHETLVEILGACGGDDVVVVDMPIGLSNNGHRPVDSLVRTRLGPRSATFFPTPLRSVLDFDDWAEANEHSKSVAGKGLSKQAWNLVPKIAEVDQAWSTELSERLLEGHPETSFAELNGEPLETKKAEATGRSERISLLTKHFHGNTAALVDAFPKKWSIDAVDAIALAWTADRVLSGSSIRLGGETDLLGRPMQLTI